MIDDGIVQRLLEADIAELEGHGNSETARLVREDAAARAIATRMLTEMREADAAIASLAAARSSAPVHVHSRAPSAGSHGSEATPKPPHPSSPSTILGSAGQRWRMSTGARARPALATIGLAAAAVALVLLAGPEPTVQRSEPETAPEPLTASLNVSSSRPFAVFPTDNPDIAIVWLFEEEER